LAVASAEGSRVTWPPLLFGRPWEALVDEPLYCTHCGAEDWECSCPQDNANGPFCEVDYHHEWIEIGEDRTRCRWCGLEGILERIKTTETKP